MVYLKLAHWQCMAHPASSLRTPPNQLACGIEPNGLAQEPGFVSSIAGRAKVTLGLSIIRASASGGSPAVVLPSDTRSCCPGPTTHSPSSSGRPVAHRHTSIYPGHQPSTSDPYVHLNLTIESGSTSTYLPTTKCKSEVVDSRYQGLT